jgi:hypothetical protein
MDIVGKLQHVSVILHDNAFVTTLKQMPASKMPPIKALRVSRAKPVHGFFQIRPVGSGQKVVMIAHRNIGKNVNHNSLFKL